MPNAVEKLEGADRAVLSRYINRGIMITQQIKALDEELKEIKSEVYARAEGPGKIKSNQGMCEIRRNETIVLPSSEDGKKALVEAAGQRYADLVEEETRLKPTSSLKRLLSDPGPAEQFMAEAIKALVKIQEIISVRFIGEG